MNFKVGSRQSQLAMLQTGIVVDRLKNIYPGSTFEIIGVSTIGDKVLDVALSKIGDKSLFTKELEVALLEEKVDFVVHSLKDMPTLLPPQLTIAAITKREDPRDAVLLNPKFENSNLRNLPPGSKIGTSSLRRAAQLRKNFPHLEYIDIRGNLNTRLAKLDHPDSPYAGIILAAAGVKRMGWENRIAEYLETEDCLYAVGQGALAVECASRNTKLVKLLEPLNDPETYLACLAERSFLRTLEGGCSVPVAVESSIKNNVLFLKGAAFTLDGSKSVCEELSISIVATDTVDHDEAQNLHSVDLTSVTPVSFPCFNKQASYEAAGLGRRLGHCLIQLGVDDILREVRNQM